MTDTAWKPTPGRDAMTRDGRRATNIHNIESPVGWAFRATVEGRDDVWRSDGCWNLLGETRGLDLVADWPDADPLPDADGWEPKVGDRVKLVKDGLSTVGAVGMEGVIKEIGGAGQHPYLIELDEGLVYESYAVPEQYRLTRAAREYFDSAVRPAPSGPVVEETAPVRWKHIGEIVQGDYGRLSIGRYDEPTGRVEVRLAVGQWYWLSKAELLAISKTTRQIGEAMEEQKP